MERDTWTFEDLAPKIVELREEEDESGEGGDGQEGAESWIAVFGPVIKVAIIVEEVEPRVADKADKFKDVFATSSLREFIREVEEILRRKLDASEIEDIVLPHFAAGLSSQDAAEEVELRMETPSPF